MSQTLRCEIIHGDCLKVMPTLQESSIDSIVCDPPYGLSFMGAEWDHGVPGIQFWKEMLRLAKPGAHLLAFGGTRTHHRLMCAIEDAGWEIRDVLMWVYGSGFPKSLNVSKAIDKEAGAERIVIGQREDILKKQAKDLRDGKRKIQDSFNKGAPDRDNGFVKVSADITAPSTQQAKEWDGWGTALKPAWEPIVLARKPLEKGFTVAANVVKYGTGAINVDESRVPYVTVGDGNLALNPHLRTTINGGNGGKIFPEEKDRRVVIPNQQGRYPANLLHDGSEEVLENFPESKGQQGDLKGHNKGRKSPNGIFGSMAPALDYQKRNDTGSAARFFYCAKATKADRGEGNNHPTVKPTSLMRYLCRLVTPAAGLILDPFAGSGSTGKAARLDGFNFIGIELDKKYSAIAKKRVR